MIKILVKNRLLAVFGSVAAGKVKKDKEIKNTTLLKKILFGVLYIFVIAVFLSLSVGTAYLFGKALLPGAEWLYYLLFMLMSITFIFVLSIFETKAELFECKDNDLLLSMPIKPRDITAARVIIVMIYNYVINSIVMIPAIVFYGVFTKDIAGIFGGILMFLFLPLFATALASLVGYLVAEISRKIKFKNLVTVIVTFAFLGVYFWFVEFMENNIESFLEGLMGMSADIAEKYKILPFIGNAALLKPLSTLAVIGISILSAALAYVLISMSYVRIVTSKTGVSKSVYKEKRLKQGSAVLALTKKDIRKFFSSPLYILNGFLGLVFAVGAGVFAVIKKETIYLITDAFGFSDAAIAVLGIGVVALIVSMTIISAAALSLEGKNLWILKTMPIDSRSVLFSKALMQFAISVVPILLSTVMVLIVASPSVLYWIICIILGQVFNLFFSFLGILSNVMFPKFEYNNEAQVVKQSLSTLVSMLFGMLVSAGLLIGSFFLCIKGEIFAILLMTLIPFVLTVIEAVLLAYPASERYKKLYL